VTVRLQENLVLVETDPRAEVQPSAIWNEVERVGFVPGNMEILAEGVIEGNSLVVGGGRWPLEIAVPASPERRKVRLRVMNGGQDPPRVELMK
jgi:hypothetical protein